MIGPDERGIAIPPTVSIYTETAKRVAKCSVCDRPIPKGRQRLAVEVKLRGMTITGRGGGMITKVKRFMHPECFQQKVFGDETPRASQRACFDCGEDVPGRPTWAHVGSLSPALLCAGCATSRRWLRCTYCTATYPRPRVSVAIDTGKNICDLCARDSKLETMKTVKARRAEDARLERQFTAIRDRYLSRAGHAQG